MRLVGGSVLALSLGLIVVGYNQLDAVVESHPLPGALMAKRSAERLTGAACNGESSCLAGDAPIASYAEYRRCGGYIESERAGQSRLACSEPWLSDVYARTGGEGTSFYREFRRACRTHDFCYVHAAATYDPKYGADVARERCDDMLLADVIRDCRLLFPTQRTAGQRQRCSRNGFFAYKGVSWRGEASFSKYRSRKADVAASRDDDRAARSALCDYEPGPHAPRDHVVSGRFVKGRPEVVATIVEQPEQRGIVVELQGLTDDGGAAPLLPARKISPREVAVADREAACALPEWSGGDACTAPQTLEDAGLKSPDWLRFAPIVIDSDGDDVDEILLLSLTPGAGLVLTHLKTYGEGQFLAFAEPAGYVAVDLVATLKRKEFGSPGAAGEAPLSSEKAIQMLAHQLVVAKRAPLDCGAYARQVPEDILLFGSRAEPADPDRVDTADGDDPKIQVIRHRMYRFYFDITAGRWRMLRDSYTDDGHKMSECAVPGVLTEADRKTRMGQLIREHQLSRLQYPAFNARLPVKCSRTETVVRESLSAISREKCPSSVVNAGAGDLNDVDLMAYTVNPAYSGDDDIAGADADLKAVYSSWLPLNWNEAADPVLTSRAARRLGVQMVSVYAGGRTPKDDKSHFILLSVYRNDIEPALAGEPRFEQTGKEHWRQRLPDTVGQPASQYALLLSDSKNQGQPYWSRKAFGDPRIFLDLPSVLAPFWINGGPGLSLVLFANRETFNQEQRLNAAPTPDRVKPGTLQIIIAPIVNAATPKPGEKLPTGDPYWLECPVPAHATLAARPARPESDWLNDFLYKEPVLPGEYFAGGRGGLAFAYRTEAGGIALTSLSRRPGPKGRDVWWLGNRPCDLLSTTKEGAPVPERHIVRMRLN